MAFVDEVIIRAKAGKGGDGVVRWLHIKNNEHAGPSGGDGGKGGDVVVRAVRDIAMLSHFRFEKAFAAENGGNGKEKSMHGKGGEDLVFQIPMGSVITRKDTGQVWELLQEGETIIVLKGGRGGKGNEHFKGSINQYPTEWTPGVEGEGSEIHIELKLIVDAGFIGMPNAGKSSLLNSLTNAGAKVGAYPFTTLDPNLGAYHGRILADIPGLIEGASEGKGLGDKFLRHISRTRALVHCVSSEHENPQEAYDLIRKELAAYDPALLEKPELILLTKTDLISESQVAEKLASLSQGSKKALGVSILDDSSIKSAGDALSALLNRET